MDKRIAICIMAALLVLVVTAAYAPGPGTVETGADTETFDARKVLEGLDAKLDEILDNQETILETLETLKADQATMGKDITYIRSKTH
jgi:hypothetical protein